MSNSLDANGIKIGLFDPGDNGQIVDVIDVLVRGKAIRVAVIERFSDDAICIIPTVFLMQAPERGHA